MSRVLPALVCALAVTLLSAGHAEAYETWCFDDPVVSVNGRLVDIQVQMPSHKVSEMRSTKLTVVIPNNVSGSVVVDDVSAFPMQTTISPTGPKWDGSGPLSITIVVDVTTDTSYEVRVVATPLLNLTTPLAEPTTDTGTTNVPLRMPMSLGL